MESFTKCCYVEGKILTEKIKYKAGVGSWVSGGHPDSFLSLSYGPPMYSDVWNKRAEGINVPNFVDVGSTLSCHFDVPRTTDVGFSSKKLINLKGGLFHLICYGGGLQHFENTPSPLNYFSSVLRYTPTVVYFPLLLCIMIGYSITVIFSTFRHAFTKFSTKNFAHDSQLEMNTISAANQGKNITLN